MKKEYGANSAHRKGERGSVIAYTVISALFLFLAVGLGADLSHLYLVKTELQNAADASALAGASALLLPNDERISTAVDRAVSVMNKNKYNMNNLTFGVVRNELCGTQQACVEFAVNLDGPYVNEATAEVTDNIRFVRVRTPPMPVNIFFSIPVLGMSRDLEADAVSGLSVFANVLCNFVPIAVVEGPTGGGVGWDGQACHPLPPPPGQAPVICDPATHFCPGCKYKMIAGPGDWHDTSPGNYQALDAGNGAHDLKLAIAGGSTNCLTSNDDAEFITETEPGRMTGPILKGLNTRFDDYHAFGGGGTVTINGVTKPIEEAFPPDTNVWDGEPKNKNDPYAGLNYVDYKAAHPPDSDANHWLTPDHDPAEDRREILMPIIHESEFQPGKDIVKFTRIGTFFLNRKVGGIPSSPEIYAEYVGPAMGAGGFDPNGGNVAPVVVPVLYR